MYNLGLSKDDYNAYLNTLTKTHRIKVRMYMMTTDHKEYSEVPNKILNGQVTVNANAQITTRVLTAELLDPDNSLGWEADDPTQAVMFINKMIRILYCVYVPELSKEDKWVEVPIFTGPVVNVERNGAVLEIEANGKEVLGREVWKSFKIPKNTNKATAIKTIMVKAGESTDSMVIHSTTGKTNEISIAYPKVFWTEARKVASSINHYAFYDGRGYFITKPYPASTSISYVFRDGSVGKGNSESSTILSDVDLEFDVSNLKNVVKVTGKKKGKKAAPTYTAYPPTNHILHPKNLGRYSTSLYMVEEPIQDDKYTTNDACKKAAETRLDARLKTAIKIKFDSLPIPHLEPNDWVSISTDRISHTFRMDEFTIPLTSEGVMPVGYTRRLNVSSTSKIKKRSI